MTFLWCRYSPSMTGWFLSASEARYLGRAVREIRACAMCSVNEQCDHATCIAWLVASVVLVQCLAELQGHGLDVETLTLTSAARRFPTLFHPPASSSRHRAYPKKVVPREALPRPDRDSRRRKTPVTGAPIPPDPARTSPPRRGGCRLPPRVAGVPRLVSVFLLLRVLHHPPRSSSCSTSNSTRV